MIYAQIGVYAIFDPWIIYYGESTLFDKQKLTAKNAANESIRTANAGTVLINVPMKLIESKQCV